MSIIQESKNVAENKTKVWNALRGPQFDRQRHGGLYDRGSADSYYHRPRAPHWWPDGTSVGLKITDLSVDEINEYLAGYNDNEAANFKKEW